MPYLRPTPLPAQTPPVTRSAGQRLAVWLPAQWQHLSSLPEPICEALLTLAVANQGCGFDAIQANVKLAKLATMTSEAIETAFAQRAQPVG